MGVEVTRGIERTIRAGGVGDGGGMVGIGDVGIPTEAVNGGGAEDI